MYSLKTPKKILIVLRKHVIILISFLVFSGLTFYYINTRNVTLLQPIIMHFGFADNNILCHNVYENDALPSAEDRDFIPSPNSIFFHETSCSGGLNSRQACAIESAARAHPRRKVYVMFSAPVSDVVFQRSCIAKLRSLHNVQFARVHITEYAKNTPVEAIVANGPLNKSKWRVEHTSDVLRYLTLYKWGGVYLDTDTLVVKSLTPLGHNWVAKENNDFVSAAAIAISMDQLGRKLAEAVINDVSRRRVTYGQLEQLWEFLNQNKAIATGYNKTSQAREFSKKMWKNIAQNLNSHGDGAIKDWKGWCKYWNDYKSKIKRLAADTRASHQQTGGGPSQVRKMTDIEKKFLQILGDDFGTGLPNIRVEPFEQDIQETESGLDMDTTLNIGTGSVPTVLEGEGGSESILTLCPVQEMSQEIMEPGPSTRVTPPPPVSPPILEHSTTTGAPDLQSTPRRSPRRRRHTRREPPMTQDAARRALIRISERRANIEEQNSETLKKLLQEMKEIKEILRLSEVKTGFRPDIWAHNGPGTITRVLHRMCNTSDITKWSSSTCQGVDFYGPKYFYPLHYSRSQEYFKPGELKNVENAYTHHLWNKITHDMKIEKDSPFEKMAQKLCPTIYKMYGEEFGS